MNLMSQNPAGNVPLLVFRIIERVAVERVCPREWPIFRPHVARLVERAFRPKRKRGRR